MFTTARNLTNLVSADITYGDGTFYTSPTQFTQLYTLHAMVVMYSLVFGLLPGKSEEIYYRYFNLLKITCQQHQLQLIPHIFLTDFQTVTRNSAPRAFTQATLKSCFFHYTQCIWRKTQKLGLATAYRDNDNIRLFVRQAAVLPLVPPELVEDVWLNVLEDSEEIILGHFTHLENNTCVVIHHALKHLSDRMDNLKGRD